MICYTPGVRCPEAFTQTLSAPAVTESDRTSIISELSLPSLWLFIHKRQLDTNKEEGGRARLLSPLSPSRTFCLATVGGSGVTRCAMRWGKERVKRSFGVTERLYGGNSAHGYHCGET